MTEKSVETIIETTSTDDERLRRVSPDLQDHNFKNNIVTTAKYNLITFLPKFLFIQFCKAANVFFGVIAILQQIPNVSPTGKFTTVVPLTFILCVAAVKEIFEDFKRHVDDKNINFKECLVYINKAFKKTFWKEIKVGQIVKVLNGQPFPADLILLSSSEPQSLCYVETAMLDGETNLKLKQAIEKTTHLQSEKDLQNFKPYFECDLPNTNLYEFNGSIQLEPGTKKHSLSANQVLLRSCILRNTEWIVGIAVYTGHESKIMMNAKEPPIKRSSIENSTNVQIMNLFILLIFVAIISTVGSEFFHQTHPKENIWYVPYASENSGPVKSFITFVIVYNNLVPISLMVTLEVVKYVQAMFINQDLEMYYEENDTPARAKTSNLNEELGQIEYIFSDKTGTLTQNIMVLKKVTVAGVKYGEKEESPSFTDVKFLEKLKSGDQSVVDFLRLMAVCHTVVPEMVSEESSARNLVTPADLAGLKQRGYKNLGYQAASPDENALIKSAKNLGFVFTVRTPDTILVDELGQDHQYKILAVLEFNSNRKRMSVIVRSPENQIYLMTKGADDVIMPRLAPDSNYKETTIAQLKEYAVEGLRTLCFAQRKLTDLEFEKWSTDYYQPASNAINDRESLLAEAYEKIEKNLYLLGATAIEDKLQDGVPDTIEILLKANIKVWVLTGDKIETALNIANSCKLINKNMQLFVLESNSFEEIQQEIKRALIHIGEANLRHADQLNLGLVVAGPSLHLATHDIKKFLDVALSCKAVLCCRVSPIQKADIVDLVKGHVHKVTLAIGDGGNDVPMIQSAHVGVGISGQEGLQAANASDYAVAQFKYLKPLLLVHGSWNYTRLAKCVLYSFYKNICLYMIQFWYAFYNGFTGQILFDRWTISVYNMIFTALQPFTIGIFDRTFPRDVMYKYPVLYGCTQRCDDFNTLVFWQMAAGALLHSFILFFLPTLVLEKASLLPNGKMHSYLFLGNFIFTYVCITVSLKAGLEFNSWTKWTHISVWGSIGFWFLFCILYQYMFPTLPFGDVFYAVFWNMCESPHFWLGCLLFPIITLYRDVIFKVWDWSFNQQTTRNKVRLKMAEQKTYHERYPSDASTHSRMFKYEITST